MDGFEEIKKLLEDCNQSHILKYWDELSVEQQKEFLKQLNNLDIKGACEMWERLQERDKYDKIDENDVIPVETEVERNCSHDVIIAYRNIGLEEISKGTVAVIVLAGGQGTRLGMSYPKGMCSTGIPSGKTLFQLQAERIKRLQELAKEKSGTEGIIHWYIMTSEATDIITDKFIQQSQYFNLNKNNVRLFKQSQVPCFDLEGKFILEEKDGIAMAPDGNGGIYKALKQNGILDEMDKKGIKYVFVHSVDNILIKVADPVFIGKAVKDKADCALKVIKKTDPKEPLGVVIRSNGTPKVVEYSEILQAGKLEQASGDGLVFNSGNICIHLFTVTFLKTISNEYEQDLKLHEAKKIITQIGPEGDKIRPTQPNCIKIEKFIFDVLPYSKNFMAWQVERSEEFSPVKNSDLCKKDCFTSAKADLLMLHKKWVENNGGICKGVEIEISPLVSYGGEGLDFIKGKEFKETEIILAKSEQTQI